MSALTRRQARELWTKPAPELKYLIEGNVARNRKSEMQKMPGGNVLVIGRATKHSPHRRIIFWVCNATLTSLVVYFPSYNSPNTVVE